MQRKQFRLSLDPVLMEAVEAVARSQGVSPSQFVERSVRAMLDPVNVIQLAAERLHERDADMREIRDRIDAVSDVIADLMSGSNETRN